MSSRHNQPVGAGGNLPSHALHPLARAVRLALVPGVVLGLGPQVAVAGPTGGQVRAGQAAITQGPGVTTINQQSARAAIDWQSFNVAKHETVQFNQPGARAATLNRIFDQKPSEIFGQVKANGQVVLMNPNGVFFKPGARVNVGSLVAGAMQVGIDDFMRGSYSLQALKEAGGRVVNQGHIEASDGDVALVGTSVANEGVIVATAGRVQLAAGEKVTVDFEGDGLLRFTVDEAVLENARAIDDQVANSGQIVAEGGDVLITASAADGVFKNSINNSGVIRAGRIENAGGKVRLVGLGPSSSVLNTGQIDASAADATSDGGTVQVTAATIVNTGTIAADASGGDAGAVELTAAAAVTLDQQGVVSARSAAGEGGRVVVTGRAVALNRAAAIDASGGQGGGEILVGGDAHGANPDVANAETTFVSSQATLTADATVDGDGGKVVVWADDTTQYHGKTTAKGGSQDGDGGFVEVSGKDTLVMRGDVDVTAAAGETGTLLLDPATLTIIDAAAGGDHDGGLPTIASGDGDIAGNTVSWGAIDALAATANVVLEATGLVTVDTVTGAAGAGITSAGLVELDLTTGSLTIRSTAGNVVFTTQTDVIRTEGGAITIDASAGTATVGGFNTTGAGGAQAGAVTILSGTGGSFGAVTTGGGTLTLNVGAGTMSQSGATSISGTTVLDKQGAGTLVLGNANTFTGTATINGGTLEVQGGSALADTVEVTLADAAGVNLAVTNSETIGALNGGGATGGDVSIAAGQVLATGDAGDDTFAGVISGATGGLTKQGAGKLTLTGTNTYGGTTTIAGGVLSVSADANLGAAPGAATPAQLEFIGGTLEATATFTLDANRGVALTGAGTFDVDTGQVLSYAGVIAGSGGGLTKADIGTLVLSGANTYTTSTNIAAGVLNVRNDTALGSAVAGTAVASGAALELQGDITIGTEALLISGSGVGGNGALRNISGSNSIAGAAILLGATTIQSDAGTLTYGGGISGAHDLVVEGAGNTTLSGAVTTATGTLTKNDGGTLLLSGANTFTGLTTVNGGTLEVQGGAALADTVEVTLADAAGANLKVTNSETLGALNGGGATGGDVSIGAGQVLTTGDAGDDTFAGVISGATGALIKQGAGKLTLTGTNTYGGATTINGGVLSVSADANLGAAPGAATPGHLVFNNGTLEATATFTLNANRGVALNGAGTFDVDTGQVLTYAGIIAGSGGGLSKADAGTLVLGGVNTYDTATTLAGGVLSVSADANLGAAPVGATAGHLTFNGGTLEATATFTLNGNRGVALAGAGTFDVDTGQVLTYAGVIAGSGGALNKADTGTLVMTGANTYTTATNVNAGVLNIQNAAALGTTGVGTTVASGAALELQGGIAIGGEALSLAGSGVGGNGALRNVSGANSLAGAVTLAAATTVQSDAGSLTLSGGIGGAGQDLTIDGAGDTTVDSAIGTGTGALTKNDAGTLLLSGTNTFAGVTTVNGGTLEVQGGAALSDVVEVTLADAAGANLLVTNSETIGALNGGGATGGNVSVAAGQVLTTGDAGNDTYTGVISGAGGLTKQGAGVFILNAINTYTGPTTVNAGTLRAGVADAFSSASAVTLGGGTLDLNNLSLTVASLGGTSGTLAMGAGAGAATLTATTDINLANLGLTFGTGTDTLTAGGTLSTPGTALNKATGALVLGGATEIQLGNTAAAGGGVSLTGTGTTLLDMAALSVDLTVSGSGAGMGNVTNGMTAAFTGVGAIDAGSGNDTLTASTASVTFGISGTNSGTASFLSGGTGTWSGFENLTGTGNADMFNFDANGLGSLSGNVTGGGGNDQFNVAGNATVTGSILGGAGDDTLNLTNSAVFTGTFDGEGNNDIVLFGAGNARIVGSVAGGTGTNTIDWSAATQSHTFEQTGPGNKDGFFTSTSKGLAFNLIESGAATDWTDFATLNANPGGTLVGPTTATFWLFDSLNHGFFADSIANLAGGTRTEFTVDINVQAGSATDVFIFSGTGSVPGGISGGDGTDVLVGSIGADTFTLTGADTINLNTFSTVLSSVESIDATQGAPNFTDAGNDVINLAGFSLSGLVNGGAGTNTLNGLTGIINVTGVNLGTAPTAVVGGWSNIQNLGGTAAQQTFNLDNTGSIASLDGLAGNDIINVIAAASASVGTLTSASGDTITLNAGSNVTIAAGTVAGSIGGSGALTKTGVGTLVLSGNNTWSGTTTINDGILRAGSATAIGDGSAVVLTANGVFDVNDQDETVGSIASAAGTTSITLGSGTLTAGGDGSSTTFAGVVSGTGGVTKTGTGILTLSGANTFTGTLSVNGGMVEVQGGAALADSVEVTLANALGANLIVTNSETIGALNGGGATGGNVTIAAAQTLTTGDAGNDTYAGVISGAGALTKQGAGRLILSGANTYSGVTTLAAGILSISADNNLGAAPGAATPGQLVFNGGTLEATVTFTLNANRGVALAGAGTFDVDAGQVLTYGGIIAGSGGTLSKADTGTLILSGANTYTTGTAVNAGVLNIRDASALGTVGAGTVVSSGAVLELEGGIAVGAESVLLGGSGVGGNGALRSISGANSLAGLLTLAAASTVQTDAGTLTLTGTVAGAAQNLTLEGAGNTTISGNITTTTGTLTKNDGGTLLLTGTNTFTGQTAINGGTLEVQGGAALADSVEVTLANAAGANLLVTNSETIGSLNGGGATGGDVSVAAGQVLTTGDGGNDVYAGVIAGAGALTKQGAGAFTLSGTNTYTGVTTVAAGALVLQGGAAIADAGTVQVNAGTLQVNASETLGTVNSLGGSTILLNGGGVTLTVEQGAVAGAMSGTGGLTKSTAGLLTLSGNSAYSGATSVAAGTLRAGSGTGFSANSAVTISAGAVLDVNDQTTSVGALTGNTGTLDLGAGGDISTASGAINLTGTTILTAGGGGNVIDAGTSTLTLGAFTKTDAGNLTLGGNGGVDLNGTLVVSNGDLVIEDGFTASNDLTASANVVFNGTGSGTFDGGALQTVTATTGTIRDSNGLVLSKSGGANLALVAGASVGQNSGNKLDVAVAGGSAIQATGPAIFLQSASNLLIDELATSGAVDTVQITTTGTAALTMDGGAGGYNATLAGDALTLVAGGGLTFQTNPLTVTTLSASFGQGGAATLLVNAPVTGATSATFTGGTSGDVLTFMADVDGSAVTANGGGGNDTFNLNVAIDDGGAETVTFNGDAGNDTFDFADGLAVDVVNGGSAEDFLDLGSYLAGTGALTFSATATDAGTVSGPVAMSYAGVERLSGGANTADTLSGGSVGSATFTVTGADQGTTSLLSGATIPAWLNIERLQGTAGNEIFTFGAGGSLSGAITGGGGTDSIVGTSAALAFDIRGDVGDGANDGRVTSNAVQTTFTDIANLTGSSANDTFTVTGGTLSGTAAGAGGSGDLLSGDLNYTISNPDSGSSTSIFAWNGIENLTGSAAANLFTFNPTGSLSGTITGAGGSDAIAGSSSALTFDIRGDVDNGADDGRVTSNAVATTFVDIANLTGSSANDTFTVTGGTLSGTANGAGGTGDLLSGDLNYTISNPDSGSSTSVTAWQGIENLTGTAAANLFTFNATGSLSGTVTGAGGSDTIAGSSSVLAFDIRGDVDNGADDGRVTSNAIATTFVDIANLTGSSANDTFTVSGGTLSGTADGSGGTGDTLLGDLNYTVSNLNAGSSTSITAWQGIENLTATGAANTFTFATNGRLAGTVDGLGGADVIEGANEAMAYTINAVNGGSLVINGSATTTNFANVETIRGSDQNDTFTIVATSGATALEGGAGADVFLLDNPANTFTTFTGDILGGAGDDQVHFGVPEALPADDPTDELSVVVGSVNLGADNDTIDFSGTKFDGHTVDLISNKFFSVENIKGNGASQLNGPSSSTAYFISDFGTGEFIAWDGTSKTVTFGPGSGATTFEFFSILAGPSNDVFFFGPNGRIPGVGGANTQNVQYDAGVSDGVIRVGLNPAGIDGGTSSGDILVGSKGADVFTLTGAQQLSYTVGGLTTTMTNVNHVDGSFTSVYGGGVQLQPQFVEATDVGAETGNDVIVVDGNTVWGGRIVGGGGVDTLRTNVAVQVVIDQINEGTAGGLSSSSASFAVGNFDEIEILETGDGDDQVSLAVAPNDNNAVAATTRLDLGAGTDTLSSTVAVRWTLEGIGSGFASNQANNALRVDFRNVENLSSNQSTLLAFAPVPAGNPTSVTGTITSTGANGITIETASVATGATGINLVAAGGITSNGALALTASGAGDINLTGPVAVNGNFATSVAAGTATIGGAVTTGGSQSFTGQTTVSGNLAAGTTVASNGNLTVNGNVTSVGAQTYQGITSINGSIINGGAVAFTGGAGSVTGSIGGSANNAVGSVSFGAGATVGGSVTTTGSQSFAGGTTITGDVTAGSSVTVAGGATVGGSVTTTGSQSFAGGTTITGDVTAGSGVTVTGGATIGGNVSSGAGQTYAGTTNINGDILQGTAVAFSGGQGTVGGTIGQTATNTGTVGSVSFANGASVGGAVTTTGDQNYAGGTSLGDDVVAGGRVTVTGGATIDGDVSTGASQSYVGATTIGGSILQGTAVAFSGDVGTVTGSIGQTASNTGTVATVSFAAGASLGGPVTTSGNQTYGGATTLAGDLSGADLVFNGVTTIDGDIAMSSSTDVFDFNNEVVSADDAVLNIVPTPGRDLFIDLDAGVGHLAADRFAGLLGTLVIGGRLFVAPGAPTMLDGALQSANANYIEISEDFATGGNLMLLGSAIEMVNAPGQNLEISAGGERVGEIVMLAFGDNIVTFDALADTTRTALGNIAGPDTGTVRISGRSATLAATGELLNTGNMIMSMAGGEVAVAQSDTAVNQQVQFNVQSNASPSNVSLTDTFLFSSLSETNVSVANRFVRANSLLGAGVTANSLFQNARVSFPNPAAVLTLLQAVSFVDSSLFEEDLSLFGQIGNGIALSLDQCEDAEGCAPSVTEEELVALIESLNERISRIETLLEAGQIDAEEGQRLLTGYRQQLQNFLTYQEQLVAYNKAKEADEFGDDFGDEFEDVFEAEETLEPAESAAPAEAAEPAEELPVFDEATEEPFAPLEEDTAPAVEEPAVEPEFEDLDEAVETFDAAPAPEPAAAEPAPESDGGEPEFEELDDEFEEFEEEFDDMLLNQLDDPRAVNQLAGTVRIGADGNVLWSGDVLLPTLHRRF